MTESKQEEPDFEKLRAERNAAAQTILEEFAKECGRDPTEIQSSFNPNACYCACPDGPCEHNFEGWRVFEDGRGGETVCSRCNMGAMSHSLRTAP